MTPKEKAEELFDMMLYNNGDEYHHCWDYVAKNCALIAVDEIIKGLGRLNVEILHTEYGDKLNEINGEIRTNYNSHVVYWNEVKKEIENL
jgi:hypothetical protein